MNKVNDSNIPSWLVVVNLYIDVDPSPPTVAAETLTPTVWCGYKYSCRKNVETGDTSI